MSDLGYRADIWRIRRGNDPVKEPDLMAEEQPITLVIGGHEAATLMATPLNLKAWAAGYCLTMGWASPADPPPTVRRDGHRVLVDLVGDIPPEAGARATGGGPMGPSDAPPLAPGPAVDIDLVTDFTTRMAESQELFKATGATHAAALFDAHGEMLGVGEDVGRHNAVDKAVGAAWLCGKLDRAAAAALSGRISLEMALKVARAGVPMVISVSAPTAQAVRKAKEIGLCICGFSRNKRINIYANPQRIAFQGEPLA